MSTSSTTGGSSTDPRPGQGADSDHRRGQVGPAGSPHTNPAERAESSDRVDRDPDLVAYQQDRFGGVKLGSAFFGWLTATGVATLLLSLLAGAGTALGISAAGSAGQAVATATGAAQSGQVSDTAKTIGVTGGIALAVILLVAYFCGGYVAARMARFHGTRQGLAVWLWGIVIAILLALLGALAGAKYNVLAQLNLPRIPVDEGTLTTGGIIALLVGVLASLAGALLGGAAGMRYHRRIDAATPLRR